MYGHSSGGALALMAAQRLGAKIARLALYEVPYDRSPPAHKAFEAYRSDLERLLAHDRRGDAVALFVRSVGVTDKQTEAMQRLPLSRSLTAMAPTLRYDTVEIMERSLAVDALTVHVPTLVMYGGASPAFMAETAHALAEAVPNATLRALEGQTHDVKPDALAPELAAFFG